MDGSDTYRTLAGDGWAELKREGSRFIAEAMPVESREEAQACVERIRSREHKATHHCSAYRVGPEGQTFHYDDDGEPSGTAGQPILRHIDGRAITNVVVVVTRYYGGTKLGTGGLVRAYGDAAAAALDDAGTQTIVRRTQVIVAFAYDDTSAVRRVIDRFDTAAVDAEYTATVRLTLGIRPSAVAAFTNQMQEATAGRATIRAA
ncbi:IMPACT family protein [Salisaeta longa]|uniref:IMPACT family protein n=1 Tax=Salisaeta longa TaxID=503170 RepID=UPI0003B3EE94|nr:YigZ family protein [Salisaeta longa]